MKIKRIVPNFATPDPSAARAFYGDLLGLDLLMDFGWICTFGSPANRTAQISFGSAEGSGVAFPELSIEVDDLDAALAIMHRAGVPIEYGPATEPWGVRRFFIRDPFGRLLNIVAHNQPAEPVG
jgi:catechol 2,3-dioxygenase-like lactoylglutathione lyase family enzyme